MRFVYFWFFETGSYDSVRQSASTSRIGILSGNNGENGENSENSENGKTGNQNKNSKERPRTAKSAPRAKPIINTVCSKLKNWDVVNCALY